MTKIVKPIQLAIRIIQAIVLPVLNAIVAGVQRIGPGGNAGNKDK